MDSGEVHRRQPKDLNCNLRSKRSACCLGSLYRWLVPGHKGRLAGLYHSRQFRSLCPC
jgi:hypothetical protein